MPKYIFITGGVVSSLGKGITAASLGRLLKSRGLKVTLQKFDPYLNVDPGTMSPYQHGEVYVTDDGAETDLDLGHYERIVDIDLTQYSSITSGKIYWSVLNKERKGDYNGGTVQVIPHVTNEIKSMLKKISAVEDVDIVITEIGGTVGDIESLPFLEAIRQIRYEVGRENVMYIHVTLLPYLTKAGELKTKPTQHSVKELLSIGIQPDILVCRSEKEIPGELKSKIALFCNVEKQNVIQNEDADSLYDIPLMLEREGLPKIVCEHFNIKCDEPDLTEWNEMVKRSKNPEHYVKIALVGKYVELKDAYLSVAEALKHGGIDNSAHVDIEWIHSEDVNEENYQEIFKHCDGILVPGGFGDRGIKGKILAAKYARENKKPYLGICLGMQIAVIEFARSVLGYTDANSTEFDAQSNYPMIHIMDEQKNVENLGGTMRLGSYPCKLIDNTKAKDAYEGKDIINERHRHRFEFNNEFREVCQENGMIISGISPDNKLVEIIELKDHPWFVAVQFHPEFKSRPTRSHPLFKDFIKASINEKSK
ncbi:MAG TPA: CTP synthase [Tissierellia bacterium]|nr:CTP synthase [Tissierellia bacterium]